MDHSRNTATIVSTTYGDRGATSKVYIHDEVGRFVTVANLSLAIDEINVWVAGVRQAREDKEQGRLWED